MLVDKNWLYEQYDNFNKEFFEGELPYVDFIISNAKGNWGQAGGRWHLGVDEYTGEYHYCVDADTLYIRISNYNDSPEKVKQQVLIHEMIHIADYYFNPEHFISSDGRKRKYDAHGEIFFMKEARRIGSMSDFIISPKVSEEEKKVSRLSDANKEKSEERASKGIPVIIQSILNSSDNQKYAISRFTNSNIEQWLKFFDRGGMKHFSDGYIFGMSYSSSIEALRKTTGNRSFNYRYISKDKLQEAIDEYKIEVRSAYGSMMNYNSSNSIAADKEKNIEDKKEPISKKSYNPFIKVVNFYSKRISETIFNLIKVKVTRKDFKALESPMNFNVNTELGPLKVIVNGSRETKLVGNTLYVNVDISDLSVINPSFILNIINEFLSMNESISNKKKIIVTEAMYNSLINDDASEMKEDNNKYIKKQHIAKVAEFNQMLNDFAKETEEFPPTLYEDQFTDFTLSDIKVEDGYLIYTYDGDVERENMVREDEEGKYEVRYDGIMDYLRFWKGCLKRAKRYWEMNTDTLDAIQDGQIEDTEE